MTFWQGYVAGAASVGLVMGLAWLAYMAGAGYAASRRHPGLKGRRRG